MGVRSASECPTIAPSKWKLQEAAPRLLDSRSSRSSAFGEQAFSVLFSNTEYYETGRFRMSKVYGVLYILVGLLSPSVGCPGDNTAAAESLIRQAEHWEALEAFLEEPIDLAAIKRKKGPSNSGRMTGDPCFNRPKRPGFYYWYGLFATPRGVSESERLQGFRLIVYKYGDVIGDFFDTNEILIAIKSSFPDPDLGAANLVGSRLDAIHARFGDAFAAMNDLFIYYRSGRALAVHTAGGKIDWYKYVRLDRELNDGSDLPDCLIEF